MLEKRYHCIPYVMEGHMDCQFDLKRHLDAEIIGLPGGVHEIEFLGSKGR